VTEEANEQAQQVEANPSQAPVMPEYLPDQPTVVPEYLPDPEAIEESQRIEATWPYSSRSEEEADSFGIF